MTHRAIVAPLRWGLRENLPQFLLLVAVNALVGATLGQGWYFARAMSTEDVLAWTLDRIGAEDDAVISDGGDGASSTGWVRS